MSLVDEEFELIWCSLSWGDTEKSCDMISKTTVVGMLLDSHELNVSVSCFFNFIKDIFGVLKIWTDFSRFLSHTYMRLINSSTFITCIDSVWMSPHELLFWVPEHAVEMTITLLHLHSGPCWVSVHPAVIGSLDLNLILSHMRNSLGAIWISLNECFETTKVIFLANYLSAFPVIKFSENAHVFCSWSPLHKWEIIIFLQFETELLVRSSNIFNTSFSRLENIKPSIF